jgi:uncharacterized protein with PIN domain
MSGATHLAIGAATLLETGIVLSARLDEDARGLLARLLQESRITVLHVTESHFGVAMDAWLRYGRGRHRAALNFGDCLSYAISVVAGHPRLTDLRTQLQATLGDGYTLERELGGGGMSRVFVARENALGREVVVKVIAPELAEGVIHARAVHE